MNQFQNIQALLQNAFPFLNPNNPQQIQGALQALAPHIPPVPPPIPDQHVHIPHMISHSNTPMTSSGKGHGTTIGLENGEEVSSRHQPAGTHHPP